MSENSPEIQAVVTEAKEGFDLKKRLQGRALREAHITLYLDETTGEELGEASDTPITNDFGLVVRRVVVREGVLGDIADLGAADGDETPEDREKRATLEARKTELLARLEQTAITVHLRAVPPLVVTDVRRSTKLALDIKGKNIPDEREEEFNLAHNARLLAAALVSIRDHESNTINSKPDLDDATNLADYLPFSEYARLRTKMTEVLFKNAVAEAVTDDADFSPRT